MRDTLRGWRFCDHLRTDAAAPARAAVVGTRTPALAADGSDLAAALRTVVEQGGYLLGVAALLSERPAELLVLNEPETSLHPSLLLPLGELIADAASRSQLIVVTHSEPLVAALDATGALDEPAWHWPPR